MNDHANTTPPFTYIDILLHMHILVITFSYDVIPILEKTVINKKIMDNVTDKWIIELRTEAEPIRFHNLLNG